MSAKALVLIALLAGAGLSARASSEVDAQRLDAVVQIMKSADKATVLAVPSGMTFREAQNDQDMANGVACRFEATDPAAIAQLAEVARASVTRYEIGRNEIAARSWTGRASDYTPGTNWDFVPQSAVVFERNGVEIARLFAELDGGRAPYRQGDEMRGQVNRQAIWVKWGWSADLEQWTNKPEVSPRNPNNFICDDRRSIWQLSR